ncbi:MAG: Nif3-like dinuclear metal center hexameric protein [Blautia massiliensis (ex Durand et al. 2017)]
MTSRRIRKICKECNRLPDVRVYGELDRKIEMVAICTGSGKSMIRDVMACRARMYM